MQLIFKGEAVRMVRQRPVRRTREEMEDLLEQMQEVVSPDCTACLHDKPFTNVLYDFTEVPDSQMTQSSAGWIEPGNEFSYIRCNSQTMKPNWETSWAVELFLNIVTCDDFQTSTSQTLPPKSVFNCAVITCMWKVTKN